MSLNIIKYSVVTYMFSTGEIFEIPSTSSEILKIVAEICTGKIFITFYLSENIDEESAKRITNEKLNNILDEIAFLFEAFVSDPNIEEININGGGTRELQGKIISCIPVTKSSIDELKRNLEENKNLSIYYRLYREAMRSESTSSFLFLYSLLAIIKGPSQKKVDKFILQELPDTIMKQSTKNNDNETIYTFLRNQVGHTQQNSRINEIKWEIDERLAQLSKLVKKAIQTS